MDNLDNIALVTDLDGTLISIDSTALSIIILLKKHPFYYFISLFSLFKGKNIFKSKILNKINIKADLLPYNKLILDLLISEKSKGRKIFLATASMQSIADEVQKHLNMFNSVYGSDENINLSAENKLNKLENLFNKNNFDYIGDSNSDLAVWKGARIGYAVKPNKALIKKIKKLSNVSIISEKNKSTFPLILNKLKLLNWLINIIIFIPLILTQNINNEAINLNYIFLYFSLNIIDSIFSIRKILFSIADYKFDDTINKDIIDGELNIFHLFRTSIILFLSLILLLCLMNVNLLIFVIIYFIISDVFLRSKLNKTNNIIEIIKLLIKISFSILLIRI